MSFIHWDKSVLSFHLKEIIEDHRGGDQTALLGLGAIFLGTVALPVVTKFGRPILKAIIKAGLLVYEESKPSSNSVSLSKVKRPSVKSINNQERVVNELTEICR